MPSTVTLRLELQGIDPVIWRSFKVPGTYTLAQLHRWIQQVMGWSDTQIYKFYDAMDDYTPASFGHPAMESATTTDVALVSVDDLIGRGSSFFYHYGVHWAGWRFELRVLSLATSQEVISPTILDGQCASPPEAAHGPQGYMEVLRQWSSGIVEPYVQAMLPPQFDPMRFDSTTRQRLVESAPSMSLSMASLPQPPQSIAPAQPAPERRPFGWLRQKSRVLYDAARDGDVERFVDVLMLEMLRGEMDMVDRRRLINLFSSAEQLSQPIVTTLQSVVDPSAVSVVDAHIVPQHQTETHAVESPTASTSEVATLNTSHDEISIETSIETSSLDVSPDHVAEDIIAPDDVFDDAPHEVLENTLEEAPQEIFEETLNTMLEAASLETLDGDHISESDEDVDAMKEPVVAVEEAPQSWHISEDVPTLPQIITLKKCLALLPESQLNDMAETLSVTTLDPERRVLETQLSAHLLQADQLMDIVRVTLSDAQTRLLGQICQMNGLMPQFAFQDDPIASADANWFVWSHDGDLSILRRHGLVYLGRRGALLQVVIPGGLLRLLRGVVKAV